MNSEIKLSQLNRKEALRYLGYKKEAPDLNVSGLLDECEKMVLESARPRYIYKVFKFNEVDEGIAFENTNLVLRGNSIREHLKNSELAVCMAVTISDGIDKKLRLLEISDMARGVVFDSLSSVAVEQVCDKVEQIIHEEYPDYYQTFRFGIGYGDLPLEQQIDFVKVLNASKLIGINVNKNSYMMSPCKSVTAIIGLSKEPVNSTNKGCATCNLKGTCKYRESGGHCND